GMQSASSSFPCIYCEKEKKTFGDVQGYIDEESNENELEGCLRTLGSIRMNAQHCKEKRVLSNVKSFSAKEFKSCVAKPLFNYDDELLVLDLVPPMELHLLLGVVNRLYDYMDKALAAAGMSVTSKDWSDMLFLSRRHYHGGQFIGNHCSKLLDEVDSLEMLLIKAEAFIGIPYVEAFRAFKQVKDSCFGFNLTPGYEIAIKDFISAYLKLGIPVSLKVHIIFEHIIPFCEKNNKGLGWFS
ncbi:unnamed protein product, partial [Meganyctiphanes norvegica]